MKIDSIQVGPIMTNCFLLCDDAAGVCCVIDPGDEPARVEQMVQRSGCELRYILLTHGHFDHCTGVAGMLERHPELPVYICEKDVTDGVGSEMQFARLPEKNQRYYKDGDTLTLGALTHLKGAKADQRDLVAVLQGSGDGVQGAVDSSLGILLGQVRIVRNSGDQFNFRHSIIPPKYYISKKRLRKSPSARLTS